jgi:hypothetical protein
VYLLPLVLGSLLFFPSMLVLLLTLVPMSVLSPQSLPKAQAAKGRNLLLSRSYRLQCSSV